MKKLTPADRASDPPGSGTVASICDPFGINETDREAVEGNGMNSVLRRFAIDRTDHEAAAAATRLNVRWVPVSAAATRLVCD